jgi:hypothetical protein
LADKFCCQNNGWDTVERPSRGGKARIGFAFASFFIDQPKNQFDRGFRLETWRRGAFPLALLAVFNNPTGAERGEVKARLLARNQVCNQFGSGR